jgi:hypothetical protein
MTHSPADLFHGLFDWKLKAGGSARKLVVRQPASGAHRSIPCPETGRPLQVATIEVTDRGVCPACTQLGSGGYVSFVADLRLAFACPSCRKLVWMAGA